MRSRFSLSTSLLTLSFLLSPFSDFQANARWSTEDETNIEYVTGKTLYKVNKDGSYTEESETQLKVLNEAGRQTLRKIYAYDATRSTLEVLEAKTTTDGKENVVPKEKIEDKPLASDPSGLSDNHQVFIPFECVAVGSIIHLKLKRHYFKPIFENYFAEHLTFQDGYLWTNNTTTIESELPLFWKINDPRNC